MDIYYFIQKGAVKEGPFKLNELREHSICFDELVWRSDQSDWKVASEFDELKEIVIFKPPLTPKEERIKNFSSEHKTNIIFSIIILYVIISFIISVFSFVKATSSWNTYLEQTGGQYTPGQTGYINLSSGGGYVMGTELYDNQRYPMYERGVNLENIYGLQQGLFFRSFKPFFSTLFLTRLEQDNIALLFKNVTLSTFVTLLPFLLLFGSIFYVKIRASFIDEIENSEHKDEK